MIFFNTPEPKEDTISPSQPQVEAEAPPPPPPKPKFVEVYALKNATLSGYVIRKEDLIATKVAYGNVGLYFPIPPDTFVEEEGEAEGEGQQESKQEPPPIVDENLAYTSINTLINAYVIQPIGAGEPILVESIEFFEGENPLQRNMAKGTRLWSTSLPYSASAGGLLDIGHRVDVMFSRTDPDDETVFAKIILENVKILSINGRTSVKAASEEPLPNDTEFLVGLEVLSADAETLTVLEKDPNSQIILLPRAKEAGAKAKSRGATTNDIINLGGNSRPTNTVTIIRGRD